MALLRMSLLKLVRRPATWIVFAILAGLIALVFLSLGLTAGSMDASMTEELQIRVLLDFPTAYTIVAGFVLAFGGLLGVAYGAAIIGADWAWGTIRAVVARGESRVRYTLVTFLAITIVIGIGVVFASVIGIGAAIVGAEMAGLGSDQATDPEVLATLPELLARAWLGVTQAAAIGFAIAMLFKSQLAGIGAGLAFYFAEQFLQLVPGLREVLVYFPFSVSGAVIGTTESFEASTAFGEFPVLAADTAVVWSLGYLLLALLVASLSAWRAQITQ
jgi:ABC-type transport system involved in multi-copper enzyme maturation permease subunit